LHPSRHTTDLTCAYNVQLVDERGETATSVVSGSPKAIVDCLAGFVNLGFSAFNFMVSAPHAASRSSASLKLRRAPPWVTRLPQLIRTDPTATRLAQLGGDIGRVELATGHPVARPGETLERAVGEYGGEREQGQDQPQHVIAGGERSCDQCWRDRL
jgi:hypothetical protein